MRIALTIAGSDSGGGAGIQADLKTFTRFGLFGTSVITAITAQNTRGVTGWDAVRPDMVTAQLDAVASDLRPHAVKTGMLGDADVVHAVADGIMRHALHDSLVVDPVMVATSGDLLLTDDAVAVIRTRLIPLARLVTPNVDEARVLLNADLDTVDDLAHAAESLVRDFGARAALVKGGHLGGDSVTDVLYDGETHHFYTNPRLATHNTHGTGCTLSAAIAALLAIATPLVDAVHDATQYVHRAIATAPGLGQGHGPLNHLA